MAAFGASNGIGGEPVPSRHFCVAYRTAQACAYPFAPCRGCGGHPRIRTARYNNHSQDLQTPMTAMNQLVGRHEIILREKTYGGGPLPKALEYPCGRLAQRREIVLLIHGFNVNVCSAGCSYDLFLSNTSARIGSRSAMVYWAGDTVSRFPAPGERPGLGSKIISALSYPKQRKHAVLSAQLLSSLISSSLRLRTNVKLIIIAHSLGCRVALEFLNLLSALKNAKQISIPLAVLMAPAVPLYAVLSGGHLRAAIETPDKVMIYRSMKDDILKWVFRPGQILERPFPEGWPISTRSALGRNGFGVSRPPNVQEEEKTCGHREYWSRPEIAREISQFYVAGASRMLRSSRELQTRVIEVAQVPGRRLHGRRITGGTHLSQVRKHCPACG